MGDFLDELIADGEKEHPGFSKIVDDAYRKRVAARASSKADNWMVVRVELLSEVGQDFDPPPGRDFLVSSRHTFRAFADAINTAFARWELNHLHIFRVGERAIGTKVEDLDFEDDHLTRIARASRVRNLSSSSTSAIPGSTAARSRSATSIRRTYMESVLVIPSPSSDGWPSQINTDAKGLTGKSPPSH